MRVGLKTSADFNDNGNVGTKLIFFSKKNVSGQSTNHYINLSSGSATNKVSAGINLQYGGSPASRSIPPSQLFPHGAWYDYEVVLEANTPGVANGIAKTWINGIQVVDETNVLFFPSLIPAQFTSFYLDPTFGGGSNPPPVNQSVQLAQWYYESAP
jgi:hypothetical protein